MKLRSVMAYFLWTAFCRISKRHGVRFRSAIWIAPKLIGDSYP